jgi:uncharacterized membrane protein
MPHAEHATTIERPVEEVFRFLAAPENDPQWRRGVLDIARVSGEGVGARYRQGVKGPFGRRIPADIEITERRESELISFRGIAGPVRPHGRYELSSEGGTTRVRFTLDAELAGARRLMAPMVQRQMDAEVGAIEELKRVLERPGSV